MQFIKRSSFLQKAERYILIHYVHSCVHAVCTGLPVMKPYTHMLCFHELITLILNVHTPTRLLWGLFSCACPSFDFRGLNLCFIGPHYTHLSGCVNVGCKHKYKWHNIAYTDEHPAAEQE